MRATLLPVLCLALLSYAAGQQKEAMSAHPSHTTKSVLEAKVHKAWEDYKNKDKKGYASVLAEGFAEVEDDGEGARDAKTEISEIDQLDIKQYTLKDITVRPLGSNAAFVTYIADYSGTAQGQPVQEKDFMGEVWVKQGGTWKELHVQATKVK